MDRRRFLTSALALAAAAPPAARASHLVFGTTTGFTRLRVVRAEFSAGGRTAPVYRIEQADGTLGWSGPRDESFRVVLENAIAEPIAIHWHGLVLPNGQDGVPYVTQPPIKPGEERLYDFPLVQAGTYWMHSHFGLQEQPMMTAPLIISDPGAPADVQDVVISLNDFTFRDPAAVLAGLRSPGGRRPMSGMSMPAMSGSGVKGHVIGPDLNDVRYDAFLANRRPPSDPHVVRVERGQRLRLRIINMASGTNFFVDPGRLSVRAVAVDGEDIVPTPGTRFELGIAQRIDLLTRIPGRQEGAYPIMFQGEGTDMLAAVVLATEGAVVPRLSSRTPEPIGAFRGRQEALFRAAHPLPPKPVDRRLRLVLGGNMTSYVWSLNGQVWPKITPLEVGKGERVELSFVNETTMTHPMHLHGHVFQVTEIGGVRLRGAVRDTVLVMPRQTVKVEFDALYPGYWMIHCHVLYHQAAGMMSVLHYRGFESSSYDPLASLAEFPRR